jgi:hypothetical protein
MKMKKLCLMIILLFPLLSFSQEGEMYINVHFYPHSLSPQDILLDGPFGKNLDIRDDTFLIWVDLFPGMFFTHQTAYILISKENVRVERGNWWPVLNGKMILHNENGQYALISPFELSLLSSEGSIDEKIVIHVYPHVLTPQDELSDGPLKDLFSINNAGLLIWVDLLPAAFFSHPTAYVFISRTDIQVENGNWWPILNGKKILYGQPNKFGILSPMKVSSVNIFQKKIKWRRRN